MGDCLLFLDRGDCCIFSIFLNLFQAFQAPKVWIYIFVLPIHTRLLGRIFRDNRLDVRLKFFSKDTP